MNAITKLAETTMQMLFREKLKFLAISLALATVTGLGLWNATASEHGGDAEMGSWDGLCSAMRK